MRPVNGHLHESGDAVHKYPHSVLSRSAASNLSKVVLSIRAG